MAQQAREREQRQDYNNLIINNNNNNGNLANDPAALLNNNNGAGAAVNDFPPLLMRRYELRILPVHATRSNENGTISTAAKVLDDNNDDKNNNVRGLSLREVRSSSIGQLVTITGMIVRASDVKPHCVVATYTCDKCGCEVYQEIKGREFMPLRQCPTTECDPNGTGGGDTLFLQTRGSKFIKFQELKLQELPHQVPIGHIPRCMSIHVHGELTRSAMPGDVVTIDGVFLPLRQEGGFRAIRAGLVATTFLEATRIVTHKKSYDDKSSHVDPKLIEEVIQVAHSVDPVGRLSRSIAPEIFGMEDVKRALLLQLVGGAERKQKDGMRIRGDINICLMGDPGVAKSQLLKYIASVAPRGVYTTGKGSSGVGLTAAITKDTTTGEMALEGGALVLADKGICCIDEFDKMDENDRTAIHEVMEQQTVSIAKAGIVATLNARSAVLAAANPLYGRYNRKKSLSENVNLPNSLLSRFDLMFLLLDTADTDKDMALARHVTFVHRHNGVSEKVEDDDGNEIDVDEDDDPETKPIDSKVMREYISKAREYSPMVPPDVSPYIVEAYVGLRMQSAAGPNSIKSLNNDQTVMTARQLLSILRLSQSLARLRFSDYVAREDVDEAIRLTHMSKASLFDNDNGSGGKRSGDDVISRIFNVIRDYATATRQDRVEYSMCEAMVLRKGFTTEQLQTCIEEYQALNVLALNSTGTHVDFLHT